MKRGLLAEFAEPAALVTAIVILRRAGYRELDAYTPFPVAEVEHALQLPPSRIPWFVLGGGLAGAAVAYFIQWWTNAVDMPLNVGSFAPHAGPAFIPITFESTILLAALTAFVMLLVSLRLPRLWQPIFESEAHARASNDRFVLAVDGDDPTFDGQRARELLAQYHPLRVESFGGAR